ncbi:MAG: leucyl aminopeptidase [Gammaproteobacteria bacterium]|nr:leucyl aminopeptidase [Gammaproteobacteria bacterium]
MRFDVKTGASTTQKTACLILPLYSSGPLPQPTKAVDKATQGLISELVASGDIDGKSGSTLLIKPPASASYDRIMLVGCGEKEKFDRQKYRGALQAAFAALRKTNHADAVSYLNAEAVKGTDICRRARISIEVWHDGAYRFTAMKSKPDDKSPAQKSLSLAASPAQAKQVRQGIQHGDAIGKGVSVSREVGNLPANVCTPSYLASQARSIARGRKDLQVQVLNEQDMAKLKMDALLSVTAGTDEPAKLIILNYSGAAKSKRPTVLVGKGVTFDSGGISLKPAVAMDEMKFDMCGAATVLGVMHTVAALKLSINVIGIIPAVENLPGGNATKPGDIVTSMSGQTIEILNTDAEGRLILCDALCYAKKFKPAALIDIATLTGACLVALGRHRSGLLSNSDRLAAALLKAGDNADDPCWRLPLDDQYKTLLKSRFADMANIGGRDAGTITAACFLEKFVGDNDWAHLDIAGTAWLTGNRKGSTGRPIPLLVEYLLSKR